MIIIKRGRVPRGRAAASARGQAAAAAAPRCSFALVSVLLVKSNPNKVVLVLFIMHRGLLCSAAAAPLVQFSVAFF